jgi:hypothetical protein
MLSISIVEDDVLHRECDLLVLKHADGFYGVDQAVAEEIGFNGPVEAGQFTLLDGRKLRARQILFVGVGPLEQFRYGQIREFGHRALRLAEDLLEAPQIIAMTLHGTGYGLDESEAFLSLIGGLMDAVDGGTFPATLRSVEIVERSSQRATRLRRLLSKALEKHPNRIAKTGAVDIATVKMERRGARGSLLDHRRAKQELANYGSPSETKIKVFIAMPFSDEYSDEFDIAIMEAAQESNIVCERIDKEAFVGDVLYQIKRRIGSGQGVLALLNDANPNVFLEIGYAWGREKPTVLMIKKGHPVPFDITGQKCIKYSSIKDLRTQLKVELKALIENGTLVGG